MFGLLHTVSDILASCGGICLISLLAFYLSVFDSLVVLPTTCSLPFLRSTSFCTTVDHQTSGLYISSLLSSVSPHDRDILPFSSPICTTGSPDASIHPTPVSTLDVGLETVCQSYSVGQQLNDLVLSLEDVTAALRSIHLVGRDDALAHSIVIRDSSRKAATRFHEYISGFIISVQTILTMSDFAVTIAAQVSEQASIRRWTDLPANEAKSYSDSRPRLLIAFKHTLKALDAFNTTSTRLSLEAFDALSILARDLDDLYEYTIHTAIKGHDDNLTLMQSIFALLWGKQLKRGAREHILALVAAGIRRMQSSILEAQTFLATLEISARGLRAAGADAEGSDEPIQIEMTIRSLEIGCVSLLGDLADYHLLDMV